MSILCLHWESRRLSVIAAVMHNSTVTSFTSLLTWKSMSVWTYKSMHLFASYGTAIDAVTYLHLSYVFLSSRFHPFEALFVQLYGLIWFLHVVPNIDAQLNQSFRTRSVANILMNARRVCRWAFMVLWQLLISSMGVQIKWTFRVLYRRYYCMQGVCMAARIWNVYVPHTICVFILCR